ncbi:hypothetical protein LO771_13590 [Streptacidiphilus sp. ASG 303]|uniref:hypothetical protein n=1 Tax=Streptacidiphilus sp. ASG 303 TaxID=2896847 RepID=UPI001E608FAA|nr:hypothetical protein [Streptacidiphilus sp. ASG 303]MCD0483407.1 hypothetical protein [Streptacidiphilus sp. ASG 303]
MTRPTSSDQSDPPAARYRMVVTSGHGHTDTAALADQRLRGWLKQEGYDEPPAAPAPPVADGAAPPEAARYRIGDRASLDLDAGPLRGGTGRYLRRRVRQPAPHGVRQTTLTVATPSGGPTWVRLEAEHLPNGPGVRSSGRVPVPGLARDLLPLLDASDGPAAVRDRPAVVGPRAVDRLIDELCDPDRRLPIVVASVPADLDRDAWLADAVRPAVAGLTGLAVLYVLDHAARPAFNLALEYHPVYGGAVRTYLPGLDPAARGDGVHHPVMSRRLLEDDPRRAAAILAREPRRLAADTPLPDVLADVPVLRTLPLPPAPPRPGSPPADQNARGARTDQDARAAEAAEESAREEQAGADELQRIRRQLQHAERLERSLLAEADDQYEALRHARAQVRVLTRRLVSAAGPAAADPAEVAGDARREEDANPATFAELVARLGEFPSLVFTGDVKEALALDERNAGPGWARLAWDGLLALQDYADAAARGRAHGDFKQWCEHTPPDCHPFPPRKAVRGESHTVSTNAKWKKERMLPVPHAVDPSGRAFMGAHLRIGGGGTAPRLHYLDDCSGTGRIYIGYIGLHLTNTRTN